MQSTCVCVCVCLRGNDTRSLSARIGSFQMGRSDRAIGLHSKSNSYVELALSASRWAAANGAAEASSSKAAVKPKTQ